ncbi:helix-turn-helix domain-containing protein [Streptomyces olivochromogenes]|uniref:helix-turn-helix domain-containing protein n=1 Tax=Streptomyces olivochromogenes TaxID=1963 RepID=UPI001F3DECCB|nr:helix-turn-helix domain-containing protein [Streptomyces olivochromogenes]MCF3131877.1 helix-turn-helix domain-containing protein [Streptomyces olivochromogenes]
MAEEDLRTHLCRLGLSHRQADIYMALLAIGPCRQESLARDLDEEQEQDLEGELAQLRKLGLITVSGTDVCQHVPVEPTIALEYLAHARTAELRQSHQAAVNAYRGYRRSVSPQATENLVEVVTGPSIAEHIWNIEEAAETQVLRFDSPPYHTHGSANPIEVEKLKNGVEYRVVYSKSAIENSAYYSINIQPCIAAGEHARILPTVPVKLTIFDQRLAIVSMSFVEAEVNDSLLIVHPSSLLSALTGLFETSWRTALPMHLNERVPSALSPMHRRILELLATGVTDETIAELLGVSRRTLSRHLEQLNTRAGSLTRFQMALHATRNGWI